MLRSFTVPLLLLIIIIIIPLTILMTITNVKDDKSRRSGNMRTPSSLRRVEAKPLSTWSAPRRCGRVPQGKRSSSCFRWRSWSPWRRWWWRWWWWRRWWQCRWQGRSSCWWAIDRQPLTGSWTPHNSDALEVRSIFSLLFRWVMLSKTNKKGKLGGNSQVTDTPRNFALILPKLLALLNGQYRKKKQLVGNEVIPLAQSFLIVKRTQLVMLLLLLVMVMI